MMRLGLLGGTFDPVHHGHLDVAQAAIRALGLPRVLLVPSNIPPHRRQPLASAAHRFAMAALAAQPFPELLVSDIEMERQEPSYTATTLGRLAERGVDTTSVCFVTGADAFRDIATWKDYPAILDRCHFVAVSRPGHPAPALRQALPALANRMVDAPCDPPARPAILLVDAPTTPVSSTVVRDRLRAGEPIADLVPLAVAAYIEKHGLYRSAAPRNFA